jgi:mono/diheme cytochrome c family protein
MRRALSLALALLALATPAAADSDNYVEAARGKALATVGDCVACHTAPGGKPFAGGLALVTPFGTINTPNLTPDEATGIGRWTADGFARAVREGRRPDGTHLYPAFPYPYYTKVSRQDVDAIYAYLRTLAPVSNSVDRNTLAFPFGIRALVRGWNWLFFERGAFKPDPAKSAEFNRGAYLVEGLGHCGACHTPLNFLGANKADQAFQGNEIQTWIAPNITNDARLGLGKWSVDEIVQYLKTGQTRTSIASGPMKEVIENSTSKMPDADLKAMATYLKERGAAGSSAPQPLPSGEPQMRVGQAIFTDTCMACHTSSGDGVERMFPRLAGNAIVNQDDPTTLVRVILTGTQGTATATRPTAPSMPSLGFRLSDAQVAAVVTYIRNSWGNAAAAVSGDTVGRIRAQVVPSQAAR